MSERASLRRVDGQEGSVSTELTLLVPVLLLLVMFVVQMALWLHARNVATSAAQEGLLAAQVLGGTDVAGRDRAVAFLREAGGVRGPEVSVTRDATSVEVEVVGTAPTLLPVADTWPVRGVATGPLERFIQEPER